MATAESGDNIAFQQEVRAVRQRGKRLADLAASIYAQTKHLHGLTKTSLKLVRAAAMARAVMLDGFSIDARGKRSLAAEMTAQLNSTERSIVLTAAAGLTCDQVPPRHQLPAASKKRAVAGIALRIAAILDLAEGLDHTPDSDTRVTAVVDNSESVQIEICGGPAVHENAAAAAAKVELWNCTALRPIRGAIAVASARPVPPMTTADEPLAAVARRIMQRHLERLIARQYGLAYNDDLEYVHEMRVAIRRLRGAMRVFRRAFVGGLERQSRELRQLADVLGAARDADVFVDFLKKYSKNQPRKRRDALRGLIRCEKDRRRESYRRLMRVCRSAECQKFLGCLYQALCTPSVDSDALILPSDKGLSRPVGRRARRALARGMSEVVRFGRRLQDLSAEQLHQLRIACKKLRYAAEFFTDIFPPDVRGLIGSLVQLQDLLGKAHDADIYAQRLGLYFERQRRKSPRGAALQAARSLREHLKLRTREDLARAAALWKEFLSAPVQNRIAELTRE